MKYFLFVALCTLLISCTPTSITTTIEIKEYELSPQDTKLVLDAVHKFAGGTRPREILLCQTCLPDELPLCTPNTYRIVVPLRNTVSGTQAYKVRKIGESWKVLRPLPY